MIDTDDGRVFRAERKEMKLEFNLAVNFVPGNKRARSALPKSTGPHKVTPNIQGVSKKHVHQVIVLL